MKKRLLNALIIFLGVMASFAFYGFWNTEDNPHLDNPKNTKTVTLNTTNNSDLVQKNIDNIVTLPKIPIDKNIPIEESSKEIEPLDIPYDTPEAMEAHTQEIYDSLKPDNHGESIEKANEAFSIMDEQVRQVEEQIKAHMKISSPKQNTMDDTISSSEEPYEMELPVINE